MQDAAVARAGGMVAVIGAEDDVVAQLASDAAQGGVLSARTSMRRGKWSSRAIPRRATERRLWRPSVNALLGLSWPVLFFEHWPQRRGAGQP